MRFGSKTWQYSAVVYENIQIFSLDVSRKRGYTSFQELFKNEFRFLKGF